MPDSINATFNIELDDGLLDMMDSQQVVRQVATYVSHHARKFPYVSETPLRFELLEQRNGVAHHHPFPLMVAADYSETSMGVTYMVRLSRAAYTDKDGTPVPTYPTPRHAPRHSDTTDSFFDEDPVDSFFDDDSTPQPEDFF